MGARLRMVEENLNHFYSEYLGHFKCSEKETRLMEIAEEYHSRCDNYDSIVCSRTTKGEPIPRNAREFALINKNAKNTFLELQAQNPDLSSQEIMRAIRDFGYQKTRV